MAETLLRDNLGKVIGRLNIVNNKQELRTFDGVVLGYYDPIKNVTTSFNGTLIGYGNLLGSLIKG